MTNNRRPRLIILDDPHDDSTLTPEHRAKVYEWYTKVFPVGVPPGLKISPGPKQPPAPKTTVVKP